MIIVFSGRGQGKTTTALGLAIRALGHGKKVVVVQFMKGRKDIGEYKFKHRNYRVYQFGRKCFVDLRKPDVIDKEFARKGLEFAKQVVKKKPRPDLFILDEINLAAGIRLLDSKDVIKFLLGLPRKMLIVLTGRNAPKEFIKIADVATEMRNVKHCYNVGIQNVKILQY